MEQLNVLIKPSSSMCNMACGYCFYHSLASSNRKDFSYGFMTRDTLDMVVRKAFEEAGAGVTFAFQGGEPTLAGLDYYKELVRLVQMYNTKKLSVSYALQTNGVLIDDNWAGFLNEHDFLVGISLDGPKEINDLNRRYKNGGSSFGDVVNAVKIMEKHGVRYNILFVVTSSVARHAEKVYKFFKKQGYRFIQFIPCLMPFDYSENVADHGLSPGRYAGFLIKLFDMYYKDFLDGDFISIRYFDNLIGMLMGQRPESCDMNGSCSIQYVIEANGMVFPCDFYCTDEWCLGNINDMGFLELSSTEAAGEFIKRSLSMCEGCGTCRFFKLCRGGCRRTRIFDDVNSRVRQLYCTSYRSFYEVSINKLLDMAGIITKRINNGEDAFGR